MAYLPSLSWRLPPNVEKGAQFGGSYLTDVATSIIGTEQRAAFHVKARHKGDIGYGLRKIDLTQADAQNIILQLNDTFLVCRGKRFPFRFRDWKHYVAIDEIFGWEETGATRQLGLTYDPYKRINGSTGSIRYFHPIYLPDDASVTIKIAGTPTSAFTLGEAGRVVFNSDPGSAVLTWSASTFDYPMRFDTDDLSFVMETVRHASIGKLPIIELLGRSEVLVP